MLPKLYALYEKLQNVLSEKEMNDFFKDVDASLAKLKEAKNATTIEEKRNLRREALKLGSGAFNRAG